MFAKVCEVLKIALCQTCCEQKHGSARFPNVLKPPSECECFAVQRDGVKKGMLPHAKPL